MTYEMISAGLSAANASSIMRSDPFEMSGANYSSYNKQMTLPYNTRPHTLTLAEQAELECELRYRGNMIVEQQRKIQVLEEELKRTRDQMELMSSQLSNYEQERLKEKKKPQSRYWTPEEHQRFLEALTKFGHKDVKAISMHVSTRNATQVRTHAQKYFLRLERERRKKPDGGSGKDGELEGYGSSDMEDSLSPDMGSPMDDSLSAPVLTRRKRSSSFIITPAQAKLSGEHREAVLSALPATWTNDDYDQFVKGLVANADKQDMDVTHMCRAICENFLSHHPVDEVETCYRQLQKCVRQKSFSVSSPKRRRANSKGEPPAYNAPSPPINPFSSYVANSNNVNAFSNANNNQLASLSLHQFHIATPTPTFSVSSSLTPASSANLQTSLARSSAPPPAPMMQILDRRPLNMHLAPLSHEYGELPVLNHEVPMGHYNANLPSGFAFAFNPFHDAPGSTSSTMVSSPN